MANLRLVGVQEDGEHLILTSEDGANFSLRIDEALRVAASSTLIRPETDHHPETFTPRDIQARIRAGATPEQIAAASKLPLEHIHKYEGPVLAERAHIAKLGQKILGEQAIPGTHFVPLDAHPPAASEIIDYQLKNNGIDAADANWDAWRQNDGSWLIILSFRLTNETKMQQARWGFSTSSQKLQPLDAWAKRLSHISDGRQGPAVPNPAINDEAPPPAVTSPPEDVPSPTVPSPPAGPVDTSAEPATYGLLDKLRSRRGQRLGTNEEDDDEIALFLARKNDDAAKGDLYNNPVAAAPEESGQSGPAARPLSKDTVPIDRNTAKVLPFRDPSQQGASDSDDFYTVRIKESYDKTFSPSLHNTSEYQDSAPAAGHSPRSRRRASDKVSQPFNGNNSETLAYPALLPASVPPAEQASLPHPVVSVGSEGKASLDPDTVDSPSEALIYNPALEESLHINNTTIAQNSAIAPETLVPSVRGKKHRKAIDENPTASLLLPHPVAASSPSQSAGAYHQGYGLGEEQQARASYSPESAVLYDQEKPSDTFGTDAITERAKKKTARSKRSSVPSWDDIVFGTKGDA